MCERTAACLAVVARAGRSDVRRHRETDERSRCSNTTDVAASSQSRFTVIRKSKSTSSVVPHYVHVGGSGGTVISDNKDIAELHDVSMVYAPYREFEIIPVRMVDDAVGDILKYYGGAAPGCA